MWTPTQRYGLTIIVCGMFLGGWYFRYYKPYVAAIAYFNQTLNGQSAKTECLHYKMCDMTDFGTDITQQVAQSQSLVLLEFSRSLIKSTTDYDIFCLKLSLKGDYFEIKKLVEFIGRQIVSVIIQECLFEQEADHVTCQCLMKVYQVKGDKNETDIVGNSNSICM